MTETQLHDTTGHTRRGFLKLGTAGAATAAGLGGADHLGVPSATQDAEAIAPLAIAAVAGGVYLGSQGLEWAVREGYVTLEPNAPPEGLTPEVLHEQTYDAALKRQRNNASDFTDNLNIIESGFKNTLYGDGKLAAIEALNAEESQSDVLADAKAAAHEYATTVLSNFLKGWNASVREFETQAATVFNHADLDQNDVLKYGFQYDGSANTASMNDGEFGVQETTTTLPDGTDFTLLQVNGRTSLSDSGWYDPVTQGNQYNKLGVIHPTEGTTLWYMKRPDWNAVWTALNDAVSTVEQGLDTWVSGVYGELQAGELDTEDLLTGSERAAMTADQEDFPQALADLMALNISVNLEREAEVYLPDMDATVNGQIGVTGDTTLSTGTVNPSNDDVDYYLTYDISQGTGTWADYNAGIDGGVLTFTSEPYEDSEFHVETNAGETATVVPADFTDNGDGTWTVDLSEHLDTDISEVNEVTFDSQTNETQYETVRLKNSFEIITFTDPDGNEYDSADHSSSEAHDDTNYLTEDEWTAMEERQKELIEKYEESQNNGNDGGPGFFSDVSDNQMLAGAAAVVALAFAAASS